MSPTPTLPAVANSSCSLTTYSDPSTSSFNASTTLSSWMLPVTSSSLTSTDEAVSSTTTPRPYETVVLLPTTWPTFPGPLTLETSQVSVFSPSTSTSSAPSKSALGQPTLTQGGVGSASQSLPVEGDADPTGEFWQYHLKRTSSPNRKIVEFISDKEGEYQAPPAPRSLIFLLEYDGCTSEDSVARFPRSAPTDRSGLIHESHSASQIFKSFFMQVFGGKNEAPGANPEFRSQLSPSSSAMSTSSSTTPSIPSSVAIHTMSSLSGPPGAPSPVQLPSTWPTIPATIDGVLGSSSSTTTTTIDGVLGPSSSTPTTTIDGIVGPSSPTTTTTSTPTTFSLAGDSATPAPQDTTASIPALSTNRSTRKALGKRGLLAVLSIIAASIFA
ncbi:unnamed protein product [Cyclocybe aegerita]|uniref:Uncharacterized protein n=1 Tax=Cyclocybe aegerita TaxID=1973307 RepID=A0A8S0W8D3_CYCAE|nr:unnamed protein product [Cyclocybe aegerita]